MPEQRPTIAGPGSEADAAGTASANSSYSRPCGRAGFVLPPAAVRTRVRIPLRFADGFATTADAFTFRGLVDHKEHLLLGLGDWQGALLGTRARDKAPWFALTANA